MCCSQAPNPMSNQGCPALGQHRAGLPGTAKHLLYPSHAPPKPCEHHWMPLGCLVHPDGGEEVPPCPAWQECCQQSLRALSSPIGRWEEIRAQEPEQEERKQQPTPIGTGRCCQLTDFRGALDIASWELPDGLGCVCPGSPWHFWAGLHVSWSQATCPQAAAVALGVPSLG